MLTKVMNNIIKLWIIQSDYRHLISMEIRCGKQENPSCYIYGNGKAYCIDLENEDECTWEFIKRQLDLSEK